MSEVEEIKARYERRKGTQDDKGYGTSTYAQHMVAERQKLYAAAVRALGKPLAELKIIEVGAGAGGNLVFFRELGIPAANITANELLEERGVLLRENLPGSTIHIGDALQLEYQEAFDIVFQSTVFTSILDPNFKRKLAAKMWNMTKPGGIVLWYDFIFDNPNNPDVEGVKQAEVVQLFSEAASKQFKRVTLAPPIGRRVGSLYAFFNLFPFLRSHIVGILKKK